MKILLAPDESYVLCDDCGNQATCYGAYEMQPPGFACDTCCGHGCEDGKCTRVEQHVEGH